MSLTANQRRNTSITTTIMRVMNTDTVNIMNIMRAISIMKATSVADIMTMTAMSTMKDMSAAVTTSMDMAMSMDTTRMRYLNPAALQMSPRSREKSLNRF